MEALAKNKATIIAAVLLAAAIIGGWLGVQAWQNAQGEDGEVEPDERGLEHELGDGELADVVEDGSKDGDHGDVEGLHLRQHGHAEEGEQGAGGGVGDHEGAAEEKAAGEDFDGGDGGGAAEVEGFEGDQDDDVGQAEFDAGDGHGHGDEGFDVAEPEGQRGEHADSGPDFGFVERDGVSGR